MSDIKAMFYQVYVRPSDCNYLRFLWWPGGNLNEEPSEYQMLVHLFGGASSPSCSNFALRQTAEDNKNDFNAETVRTVKENFYVDDCLKSVNTVPAAINLAGELREILARGGFRLTKWVSNSKDVLDSIPESERATSTKSIDFEGVVSERALGVHWNVVNDTFGFQISEKKNPQTRRGILSTVSSVYDPLGFASPFILTSKIILQQLCKKRLGWDDPIPDAELEEWKAWQHDLPKLELFNINRCFKPVSFTPTIYELHHFSDASERGYGAVSYLRALNGEGDVHCSFIMAKARVAPLKAMTIPRMELAAAALATRLDALVGQEITLPISSSTFWTDSTCVLRYIANEDKRYQTFVSNRVSTIRERSSPSQWKYVETSSNPADDASRGISAEELINSQRWISGPGFLSHPENEWPVQPVDLSISAQDPEIKKEAKVLGTSATEKQREPCDDFERFSSWSKLRRVTAWILRYISTLKRRCALRKRDEPVVYNETYSPLSVDEIRAAERHVIQHVQSKHFKEELSKLSGSRPETKLKRESCIHQLDPVLIDGLLCVGGRLHHAPIGDDIKHPAILPKNHHVSEMIVRYYHVLSAHSGVEHTLSLIREKFWIVNARSLVKRLVHRCVPCRRRQAPVGEQKMANLPRDRVTPSKPPFTYVGVDCFGPFMVKRGRSQVKRYGVLFTCLAIRAIHIEVAASLDTDSFINALRRFIARRGRPAIIRSDNGGNFVKGDKDLKEAVKSWNHDQLHGYLLNHEIKWIFNPPAGSHHGGVWERCIRTVRKVMKGLLSEQTLDDEGLSTLMCEVENIVNGRPLTKVSDDPRDLEALTPNHLLLLRGGPSLPPGCFTKDDTYSRRRWKQVQYLADIFWRRWIKEYLPALQKRAK